MERRRVESAEREKKVTGKERVLRFLELVKDNPGNWNEETIRLYNHEMSEPERDVANRIRQPRCIRIILAYEDGKVLRAEGSKATEIDMSTTNAFVMQANRGMKYDGPQMDEVQPRRETWVEECLRGL